MPVIADVKPDLASSNDSLVIDVTQPASVKIAIVQFLEKYGRLDILVTLAGIYQGGPVAGISPDDWRKVLDVNLTGTFLVCREVLPVMQQQDFGRIICVASLAGQVGGVVAGANYSASKAGVLSLVKSLAKQSEKPWITVNAISPGPVDGTMTAAWTQDDRELVREQIPLRRFAQPVEIAHTVAFLASPLAGYIHGSHVDVNGGLFMA